MFWIKLQSKSLFLFFPLYTSAKLFIQQGFWAATSSASRLPTFIIVNEWWNVKVEWFAQVIKKVSMFFTGCVAGADGGGREASEEQNES